MKLVLFLSMLFAVACSCMSVQELHGMQMSKEQLNTLLIEAGLKGDKVKVKTLLEQGADPRVETKCLLVEVAKDPEVKKLLQDAIDKSKRPLPQPVVKPSSKQPLQPSSVTSSPSEVPEDPAELIQFMARNPNWRNTPSKSKP